VAGFAREHGLRVQYQLRSDPNAYVMRAVSVEHAFAAHASMAQDRRVRAAYPNQISHKDRNSFTPNDPYFHLGTPTSDWPGEWHLVNEWTPGLDAGVLGAWNRDITGQGVVIGIVDDCLQTTHPDLAPNLVAADCWDFYGNDPNPDPKDLTDMHGTSVAGVAAARGGNGIGVTGAAPLAGLAGLRVAFDFYFSTTAQFVDATLYHSSGTNTHIKIKNHSYGNQFDYIPEPAETDALATSTAAGTIHCFSAGNYRDDIGEDSDKKQPQCSPDAITVAALGSSGLFATYSSYGANVFVTAPSSSDRFYQDPKSGNWLSEWSITTTDRTGEDGYNWLNPYGVVDYFPDQNYTSQFGGTSAASPLVAGVMALGKQVQPNLNTRFAKHLLARTSKIVDAGDSTLEGDGDGVTAGSAWKTNAAGLHFDQNYGFGLINADAFTRMAAQYSGVTPLQVVSTGLIIVGAVIPDNSLNGIRRPSRSTPRRLWRRCCSPSTSPIRGAATWWPT
jgi:subtilisin family serine protease